MNITSQQAELYIGNVKFCTKEQAIAHVTEANAVKKPYEMKLWIPVLKRTDISPSEAIDLLSTLPDESDFKNAVFFRDDVQSYLKSTLTLDEALGLLISTQTREIHEGLLKREDLQKYLKNLPAAQAIDYAQSAAKSSVWKLFFQRSDISSAELIDCAEKNPSWAEWAMILERVDIAPADAMKYAKKLDRYDVWSVVLKRKDVQEYLK